MRLALGTHYVVNNPRHKAVVDIHAVIGMSVLLRGPGGRHQAEDPPELLDAIDLGAGKSCELRS
jgi:hypothetical protein